MTVMMRVDTATRDRVMKIAAEDYGGVTADEAVRRLLDEHWERRAFEAMERFRRDDPDGYADYIAELDELDRIPGPPVDEWKSE